MRTTQIFHCLDLNTGAPILITPERGRKEAAEAGNGERGNHHPKVNGTQGFLSLGHSNWTICRLLSWFCSNNFPLSWPLYWGSHFIFPQREEERKQQRLEMGKRESPKSEWDTWVSVPVAFKLDHLQPVKLIFFHHFFVPPSFPLLYSRAFATLISFNGLRTGLSDDNNNKFDGNINVGFRFRYIFNSVVIIWVEKVMIMTIVRPGT